MTSSGVMGFFRLQLVCFLVCISGQMYGASDDREDTSCPLVKIAPERLPDLHVPRAGHCAFNVNGELVVVGGHTTGFIPTATAEYYSDGEWHLLQTVYTHDDGLCVVLKSGKVLIGGGHERHLGIGQTFPVETYDPANHTFDGFGCLDRKRTMASGTEIDSGRVVIAGNWYGDDAIELFDGNKQFTHIKDVSVPSSWPYIFRTAKDDALIVAVLDTRGEHIKSNMVDRLRGEPLHVPLFETWHPIIGWNIPSSNCFIGDEASGNFSYLFPVINDDGQVAIALVRNGDFSLLPTACPIPMESPWGQIEYKAPIVVDRNAKRAYMVGISKKLGENIKYVLCIDYGKQDAAQLTLYYTNELPEYEFNMMLDSDGNLVMSGGSMYDNFKPSAAVYLLPLGKRGNSNRPCNFHLSSFIPWIIGVIVLLLLIYIVLRHRKKHLDEEPEIHANMIDEKSDLSSHPVLMENISKLMEEQKMFLNSELKVSDIAAELGTNSRYVSNCIKLEKNVTFKQFVNGFRVDYAKQLMRQHPDMKLAVVGLKSGFSNEMTFFRTFKAYTGKTPKEWVLQFEEK